MAKPPKRWLTENGQNPEDALQRIAKSQKMTYREWPNPRRWLTEIGEIQAYDKSEFARPRNINYRDVVSPAYQFVKYKNRFWWKPAA